MDEARAAVERGTGAGRLAAIGTAGLLAGAGAAVWVASAWPGHPLLATMTAIQVTVTCFAVYAAFALYGRELAGWAVRHTLGSLGLLFPLVTRALPMLLLFMTFLFINTEVWQVASTLTAGVMWATVLVFASVAVAFLLARLPEELDRFDDAVDTETVLARGRGTPMEAETRRLAEEGRQVSRLVENGIDPTVSGLPKANLILVLLIGQAVQVLLLSVSVFLFFVVFGAVAIDESVVASWIGHDPAPVLGLGAASWELIRVATFLGAFSGLYFTVYAITDGEYRAQFFSDVTEEIGRAVVGQVAYVSLGRRLAAASTPPQPPGS